MLSIVLSVCCSCQCVYVHAYSLWPRLAY